MSVLRSYVRDEVQRRADMHILDFEASVDADVVEPISKTLEGLISSNTDTASIRQAICILSDAQLNGLYRFCGGDPKEFINQTWHVIDTTAYNPYVSWGTNQHNGVDLPDAYEPVLIYDPDEPRYFVGSFAAGKDGKVVCYCDFTGEPYVSGLPLKWQLINRYE